MKPAVCLASRIFSNAPVASFHNFQWPYFRAVAAKSTRAKKLLHQSHSTVRFVVTIPKVENPKTSITQTSPQKSEGRRSGIQVSTQGPLQCDAAIPPLLRSHSVPCSSARDLPAPSGPPPAGRNKPATHKPNHHTIRQPFLSCCEIPRSREESPLARHSSAARTFPVHSGFS